MGVFDMETNDKNKLVKMWGEHVSLLHLVVAIVVNIVVVLIVLLASVKLSKDYRLMIGLGALVVALVVNSSIFRPKRNVVSK